jgi:hypothetical protein
MHDPQCKLVLGQVQADLLAQAPLGTDAQAVARDQHADHQLRIDRGPPQTAVEGRHLPTQVAQVKEAVDLAQQVVVVRDAILEAELRTACLIAALPNHHAGRPLLSRHNERNHGPAQPSRLGAARSGPYRHARKQA